MRCVKCTLWLADMNEGMTYLVVSRRASEGEAGGNAQICKERD
jgi:hypothetical protein